MIKKAVSILLLTLVLFTSLVAVTVNAEEAFTVGINCHAAQSEAKGEKLLVEFKNIENNEVIQKKISTNGMNKFTDIPIGEYELVRCTLWDNENIEFKVASRKENLIVTGEKAVYYTFRVENNYTELKECAMDQHKAKKNFEKVYVISILAIFAVFIVWCVFAIMGRKNYRKKMIAKFLIHLVLSGIGFLVALAFTNANAQEILIWIMGAGFPYGLVLVAILSHKITEERGYYVVREGESCMMFLVRFLFTMLICAFLGAIAMPIVFIIDIVKIIKAKDDVEQPFNI